MMLSRKIASGALWLISARLVTKALDLVALLIVARLLTPADFGLFALAATMLLILNAITEMSLSDAIVQMKDPPEAVYDTAFTLNLLRSIVLALALLAASGPFALLYDDPRLQPIVAVLALVPLMRGLASPRMAHLRRELQFRPAFWFEAIGKIAAFAASVAVAYVTRSYWALIAGMVAAPFVSTAFSYLIAPYRPRFGLLDWKAIFAFSGWITLSNAVNTLNWQADRLFIGSRLGNATLGHYTVGSELASMPTNAPILPIMQALYAGFAKLSQQPERLRAAYMTSQTIVVALAMPIAITVSVFAYTIIMLAVGPEWRPSAFIIQVLAPVFALQMLTAPVQSIAMVRNRTRSIFQRDLVALAIRLPLILAGLYLAGLEGVVGARIVSGLAIILLNLLLIRQLLGVSVWEQVVAPWRSYVSSAALAAFLSATGHQFGLLDTGRYADLPLLAAIAIAGFVFYAGCHLALWSLTRPEASAERKLIDMAGQIVRRPERA